MAEIVAGFAGPVIEVVNWVARPILRQLNYLCCFTSIITGLEREAKELDLATKELQERVERERENVQVISPLVESWLSKSNDINGQKDTILDEVPSVKSGCLKLGARFSLSRRAKKTTDRIKELQIRKNFDAISQPGPPAATQELPLGKTYDFESRKKIEEDIMASLRDGDVNIIGICGMGGLGKTTMAQRIMNRVLKERVFEEVVITTISQQEVKSKVQDEIGDSLGLKLQDNSPQVRAQKLHARLTGTKRILLVLDDVWEGLELQGLGIPCDSKGCTILVTSRNEDALSQMNVQKFFPMEVLPLKDAWFLFRERAGTCVDDARLNPIAKEIVDECGGLPIALLAVGAALKDEKDVSVWKDALRQLRQCDQDIPSYIEKVYNPMKLSYDFLRSRQAKDLLLLCCLFREDARISLEQLTYFCMGLGMFEGIMNLEGARNKMRTLAKMLKSRSLLLDAYGFNEDGPDEYHVRMHDVVRDVCRIIAKQGKYIGGNDCAWILSSELIKERRSGLGFPNLRLLLLARESNLEKEFKFGNVFFEGIRDLLVFQIAYFPLTSLPQGTHHLKNLNTLVLESCRELKTISVVGELVHLEILICRHCDSLKELPPGMKGLNRLKLLQLIWCGRLQSIGRGIISSLVGLEELKMLGSFNKWEAEDREEMGKNAGLKELQSLTNLTCLEIEIEDPTLVAENMHISTKLERFCITFCKSKTTDRMIELRLQKNFDPISVPQPPAATREIPLWKTYNFDSRKKIEKDIMATLRDGDVNIIGICGMGGLGKTTMAQRIMIRVLKEHVFEEVVITTISQQVDKSKVQVEIGDSLGLKLQDFNSPQVRAQKLHDRLTGTKRILLVLDDVWEGLELQGLGIPCNSKGCSILVTSRNEDALSQMDVQKVFGMEVLLLEDAWFLFREIAGTCVDDAGLNPIAKEVVEECGGLPIALTAVGATLKDEKDVSVWKDALRQLRRCDQDIPSFIEKVYNPIKLSYDFLRSRQAKDLLLLCCLFPEDARISLEQLTYFCMGLGIFEGIMNLEGARNKMRTLAKTLKSRSLLLDDFGEDEVRMHDVVRDVCRIIAKQGKYVGGNDCAWISSSELIGERTSRLGFPNLRLLLLARESNLEKEFKFGNVFFEGIRDLLVFQIAYFPLTSLPQGTHHLKNLNTLVLKSCRELKTISVVGELVHLEILICRHCDSLKELPPGMKGLNRLKLLQLIWCGRLQSIGRGIISSLVGLEELKMLGSFNKWEAEDREEMGKNAGLKELQSLTNLTCLEIEIEDPTLVAEIMHISTKLERFRITCCKSGDLPQEFQRYEKKMSLSLERETCLGHWIEMQLLGEAESLSLRGNGAKIVDLKKGQNIKWLKLSECEMTKSIVTSCSYDDVNATVFPSSLEQMVLEYLPQLQEVSISFQNISSITIRDCPRLPNLAKLSTAGNDYLPQLERISIKRCEMMEQVLLWKEDDNSGSRIINPDHVRFPKLKEIRLVSLPNLVTFCEGIEGIELPLLREIYIEKCPKWTSMVSWGGVLESKEKESGGGSSNADAYS